jgi:hypothetical protein
MNRNRNEKGDITADIEEIQRIISYIKTLYCKKKKKNKKKNKKKMRNLMIPLTEVKSKSGKLSNQSYNP